MGRSRQAQSKPTTCEEMSWDCGCGSSRKTDMLMAKEGEIANHDDTQEINLLSFGVLLG